MSASKSTNGNGNGDNHQNLESRRPLEEILAATHKLSDQVWYERHQLLEHKSQTAEYVWEPNVHALALAAARKIEAKYPKADLGPYDDFAWGMLCGKLSALRWALGDD